MEYQATSKYIRTGTRKVRLIADSVRGMNAASAIALLTATPQHAARPMITVIKSALANAKAKQAVVDTLIISSIDVMGGPALKRWHAASRGMAHPFKKRMTHVKVTLTDKQEAKK